MEKHAITDHQWSIALTHLLEAGIYHTKNLRLTFSGIIYKARTGIPWRDIPPCYGKWSTVYKRFQEWAKKDKFRKIFYLIISKCDLGFVSIDSSVVKCHQHSSGARRGKETAIGKSVGGNTTKIHAVCDSFARPIEILITEGQVHDSKMVEPLAQGLIGAVYYIADKAYDSAAIRELIIKKNGIPVIPKRKNSKNNDQPLDKEKYKIRHTVENLFARMKHFRAVATRYDKLKKSYDGTVLIVASMIWIKELAKFKEYY